MAHADKMSAICCACTCSLPRNIVGMVPSSPAASLRYIAVQLAKTSIFPKGPVCFPPRELITRKRRKRPRFACALRCTPKFNRSAMKSRRTTLRVPYSNQCLRSNRFILCPRSEISSLGIIFRNIKQE